jgi:hypothetical protein
MPKKRKVLSNYIFSLGTSKQPSDFELVSQFIINHIRKEFDNGNDIRDAQEARKEVDFTKFKTSSEMSQNQDQIARDKEDQENEKMFEAQVQVYIERQAMYKTNKRISFALIYEQCNKALQAKLKAREKYETEIKGDPIAKLKAIKEHTLSFQDHCYDAKIVVDAMRNLLNTKQQDNEDLVDFTRRFKAARDFFEAQMGTKMKIERTWRREMNSGMLQMEQW